MSNVTDSDFRTWSWDDVQPPRFQFRVVIFKEVGGRELLHVVGDFNTGSLAKKVARTERGPGRQVCVYNDLGRCIVNLGSQRERPDYLRPISVTKLVGLDNRRRVRRPWAEGDK